MSKKNIILFLFIGLFVVAVLFSIIPTSATMRSANNYKTDETSNECPNLSANLEGSENILVSFINREVELNLYGMVNIIDSLTFENKNNNPINAIFIGVPITHSEDLIFFEATGIQDNTLFAERSNLIMEDYEMIVVYFETPLLPYQSRSINFVQTYKDMLLFTQVSNQQQVNYTGLAFPILPYKAEGTIRSSYTVPSAAKFITNGYPSWTQLEGQTVIYEVSTLKPFLENLYETQKETIFVVYNDLVNTKLVTNEVNREIYVNPLGTIRVTEEYSIINEGQVSIDELSFEIPGPANTITVYDDLGEILGVTVDPEENYYNLTYKDLDIDLSENRVRINPDTKFRFSIRYFLPFYEYISVNWFQESLKIDTLTSIYEFLGKDQTIKIVIEGCLSLDYVSEDPDAIEHTQNALVLVFESEYVSTYEKKVIQFTFTVNYFDLMLRPFVFAILFCLIASAYVIAIKSRKEEDEMIAFKKELIPVKEIREYCSLIEEKNALYLEIRKAEEDAKSKKIIKKKYRNILDKNNAKIQEIEREVIPFQKIVMDTNLTFENIVKKIELLEAERTSIKDSINLLENRYKKGRLPSKAAYLKLYDNFLRRQRKVDRSIDKTVQQLRSYLL